MTQAKGGFTEKELEGLSDAEREALAGDDDDTDALTEVAGGTGDEDPAAKAAAEAKAKEEAEAKAKAADDAKAKAAADAVAKKRAEELAKLSGEERAKAEAADKAKADAEAKAKADAETKAKEEAEAKAKVAAAAATEDDDVDEPFSPMYTAKPPENYDKQMGEFATKDAADLAEFKAEKIEIDEFLKRQRETDEKRTVLREQKTKADIAAESTEQMAAQQWQWEIRRFMRNAAKHEGVDYNAAENKHLSAELDNQVKALAAIDTNASKSGEWFLQEAHRRVKAIHKVGKTEPTLSDKDKAEATAKAKAKADAEAKAVAERDKVAAANRAKLHKDIGHLPAAGAGDDARNDSEFSYLDGLNGIELENAVAKLTPDQQDRYARA